MQRCMVLPLKCSLLPDLPMPRSPVHRHRKLSAVFGTTSASREITILQRAATLSQICAARKIGSSCDLCGACFTFRWALHLSQCPERREDCPLLQPLRFAKQLLSQICGPDYVTAEIYTRPPPPYNGWNTIDVPLKLLGCSLGCQYP